MTAAVEWLTAPAAADRLGWAVPPSPEQQAAFAEEIRLGRIRYHIRGTGTRINLASINWKQSTIASLESGKRQPMLVDLFFSADSIAALRRRLKTSSDPTEPAISPTQNETKIANYLETAGRKATGRGLLLAVPGVNREYARSRVKEWLLNLKVDPHKPGPRA